ncbi:MAG: hypothetical protein ACI4XL_08550 [Bacillus sp. (in: firmicutes)]
MKIWSTVSPVVLLLLFGWSLTEAYQLVALLISEGEGSASLLPFALLMLAGILQVILMPRTKRKSQLIPDEFIEDDERNELLTARACRSAYIAMMIASPIAAALMVFQPLFADSLPYYPVLVVLLIPLVQVLVFLFSLHKNYQV